MEGKLSANQELNDNWEEVPFEDIVDVYKSVNWTAYTNDIESLVTAFKNSTLVLIAIQENNVVGVLRSISDGVSIHYLQDILVKPDYQRKGIARSLINEALRRFNNVRTHMILTDDEEKQLKFYESLGYKNTKSLSEIPLNTFVKMKGIELS